MKNNNIKNRILWVAGASTALIISFFVCRYAAYAIHGNKQWSVVLFIIGCVALFISAIFNGKKIMISVVIGYICGLMLGVAFNTYGVDSGGGKISNWWQIWTVSFFIIIIAGIVWEIVSRTVIKRKN